ncbi:hypothetical protein CBNA_0346 [Coxiella burnetii str. Namibia]|nr:hypothetical protein CBNA_0346 [Coxiella burnetii str. Namibia]
MTLRDIHAQLTDLTETMKALSREMYGFLRDREQEKYLKGVETVKENREELAAIRERLMKVGGERLFSFFEQELYQECLSLVKELEECCGQLIEAIPELEHEHKFEC